MAFLLIVFGFLGNYLWNLGGIFEEIFVAAGFILVAYFTYLNFHKNKANHSKSKFLSITIIGIFSFFGRVFGEMTPNPFIYYSRQSIDIVFTFSVFFWLGISSHKSYNLLKDKNIQEWIKKRYLFLAIAGYILSIQAVPEILIPVGGHYGDPSLLINIIFGITTTLALTASLFFALAWIFPNLTSGEKEKFEEGEDEISEEKIIERVESELKRRKTQA